MFNWLRARFYFHNWQLTGTHRVPGHAYTFLHNNYRCKKCEAIKVNVFCENPAIHVTARRP